MLLELVQYLVSLCSDGANNAAVTKKACQCLGMIGIRDFGAVSLLPPKHTGEKTDIYFMYITNISVLYILCTYMYIYMYHSLENFRLEIFRC